jgi:hypothetical protein
MSSLPHHLAIRQSKTILARCVKRAGHSQTGNKTAMALLLSSIAMDFESSASANSATPAFSL